MVHANARFLFRLGALLTAAVLSSSCASGDVDVPDPEPIEDDLEVGTAVGEVLADVQVRHSREKAQLDSVGLRGEQKVLLSIPITDLRQGERLTARLDVRATNDVYKAGGSCPSQGFGLQGYCRYNVELDAKLILGTSRGDTEGSIIASVKEDVITPFEHHDALTNSGSFDVGAAEAGTDRFLNIVIDARVPGASDNPPSNCIRPYSGEYYGGSCRLTINETWLHLIRVGAPGSGAAHRITTERTADLRSDRAPCSDDYESALKIPLGAVKAGEIFDAYGSVTVSSGFSDNHVVYVPAAIVISNKQQGPLNAGSGDQLTIRSGFNLYRGRNESGVLRRAGTVQVRDPLQEAYMHLMVRAGGDNCTPIRIDDGSLAMRRFTPL